MGYRVWENYFCFSILSKIMQTHSSGHQRFYISLSLSLRDLNIQLIRSEHLLLLFSHQVMSDSSQPYGLQHASLPCPSPSPGVCPSSCPLSWWCHPSISSSVNPFSSCSPAFPASGSFPMGQLFVSGIRFTFHLQDLDFYSSLSIIIKV